MEKLLDIFDLAELLGLPICDANRLVLAGEIPAPFRIPTIDAQGKRGSKRRWHPGEINAWIEERMIDHRDKPKSPRRQWLDLLPVDGSGRIAGPHPVCGKPPE